MNTPSTTTQATRSTEDLINALAMARGLILEMGHKIRYLDEENENLELWSQDGGYVIDDRFRLIDSLLPAEAKADVEAEQAAAPQESTQDAGKAFVVVQQGGSSSEVYIHSSETLEDAEAFRVSCEEGAYQTSAVIEVSAALAAHGEELYEVLEAVAQAAVEF